MLVGFPNVAEGEEPNDFDTWEVSFCSQHFKRSMERLRPNINIPVTSPRKSPLGQDIEERPSLVIMVLTSIEFTIRKQHMPIQLPTGVRH
jgi:hypothetical protein